MSANLRLLLLAAVTLFIAFKMFPAQTATLERALHSIAIELQP